MLPIGLHLFLMLLSEFLLFALGGMAGFFFCAWLLIAVGRGPDHPSFIIICFIFMCLSALASMNAVRLLFRKRIPARCKTPMCQGAAYCIGSRRICYKCRSCNKIFETRLHEGPD